MLKRISGTRGALNRMGNPGSAVLRGHGAVVLLGLLLMALAGCTGAQSADSLSDATPTPGPLTSQGTPGPAGGATATPPAATTVPAPADRPETPAATPLPPPSPPPLTLEIMSPSDLSGLEVGFVRVMGETSGTRVSINGLPAGVADDGHFQRDLSLRGGVNLIEVVAGDETGRTVIRQITVYVVAPTAGLPFTVLYPRDGLELGRPSVTLLGVTRPDAVVGVNDAPVEIDPSGIFFTTVDLEAGPNLIEVVAVDMAGNVRFQTVAVFYFP